jgi:hypothetical protein
MLPTIETDAHLSIQDRLNIAVESRLLARCRNLPLDKRRKLMFALKQHRLLDLRHPKGFSEKVNWRIVFDRRPHIAMTCDKLKAKDFAARADVCPPVTVWAGTDLRDLRTVELPRHWVLKPNHRTGLFLMGSGPPDIAALTARTQGWLDEVMWSLNGEWAYSQADRCYVLEERIGSTSVDLPDYKFFVFAGKVEVIQVDSQRCVGHARRLYTREWNPLQGQLGNFAFGPVTEAPRSLEAMIAVAEKLGADFDFIRVDLYEYEGQISFGELTPYPGGGLSKFSPYSLDLAMGRLWQLPTLATTAWT